MKPLTAPVLFLLLLMASPALADGPFTITYSFAPARSTSLKVIGTEGLTVTAEPASGTQSDQTPLVFQLANQDDFVPVTIAGPSSQTRVKVEVRANTQTIMQVVANEARAPREGPKYVGHVSSTMGRCAADWRTDLRFDFVLGGRNVLSAKAPVSGERVQLEVPANTYDVRIFRADRDEYMDTTSLTVTGDGWTLNHGCEPSADSYGGIWKDPRGTVVKIVQVGVGNGGLPLFRAEWPGNGTGVGFVLPDGSLAITGGRGATMAFVYDPQAGGLGARWFITGQFSDNPQTPINMATETAAGPQSFGGSYAINGRSINGNAYDGSLKIGTNGPMRTLHWDLSNGASLDGVGLVTPSNQMVAAQGPQGTFIAILQFEGMALKARFAQLGASAIMTETLAR